MRIFMGYGYYDILWEEDISRDVDILWEADIFVKRIFVTESISSAYAQMHNV